MISKELPTIYIDAGHGGINSKGHYTTSNGKLYNHLSFVFYEGYWNRIYVDEFIKQSAGIFNVVKVYNDVTDTSLKNRVSIANTYNDLIKPTQSIYLSFHSNAFNGKARGWSIFTSKGVTKSDYYANHIIKGMESLLAKYNNFSIRNYINKELQRDYEENFYVLKNTKIPAVLIENLFFDNLEDANLIMNTQFIKDYITVLINSLKVAFSNKY